MRVVGRLHDEKDSGMQGITGPCQAHKGDGSTLKLPPAFGRHAPKLHPVRYLGSSLHSHGVLPLDLLLEVQGYEGVVMAVKKFAGPERLPGEKHIRCAGCNNIVNTNHRTTIRRAPTL